MPLNRPQGLGLNPLYRNARGSPLLKNILPNLLSAPLNPPGGVERRSYAYNANRHDQSRVVSVHSTSNGSGTAPSWHHSILIPHQTNLVHLFLLLLLLHRVLRLPFLVFLLLLAALFLVEERW